MTRVGFVAHFDDGWLGRVSYFRNLLTALYALPDRQIEAVIFTGTQTQQKYFDGFPDIEIVRSRVFDRSTLPWLIRKLWLRGFSHDRFLERLLKRHGVTVLSHSGWLGEGASIPAIAWIPDFQHLRLPDVFDSTEIGLRNREFHQLCRYCSAVIVSSFDAQSDLLKFDASCRPKSHVLQFVSLPDKGVTAFPDRRGLEEKYQYSGKYFLLPNQLWKHKNHLVVIEALGRLLRENKDVLVLATGNTTDFRHPDYFKSLMTRVEELGVADHFRHIGLVPSTDLAGLFYGALAIINPSYFEGWSTSVEEAKSLGKRVVLSDIPVHREQNPLHGRYFPPDDAKALAEILWAVWNEEVPDEMDEIGKASRVADERRGRFARQYQEIVLSVTEHHA